MTKRYNAFNYYDTYIGIFLFILPVFLIYFAYMIIKNNPDTSIIFIVIFVVFILLISIFSLIPNGIKFIRQAQRKALNCEDGYIYGRVHAREFDKHYMVHHLDCIKALDYCNKDDCLHCPFRISCKQTNYTWMIDGSRLLIKQFMPSNSQAKELADIIDRYNNCIEDFCTFDDCKYYDQCLESQKESICKRLYSLFHKCGYTSADLLRR